jgi:predicted acetyltransferase
MDLRWPDASMLDGYTDALRRGWHANTMRPESASEELEAIDRDAQAFLSSLVDREGKGPPIELPDGSFVPRLPGYRKWMWDGSFCGSIGLRWQPGTSELPRHVLGHIGYTVVAWKRGRGYATRALGLILPEARAEGLDHVELSTDLDNLASQRVIEHNGGVVAERFRHDDGYGGQEALRYRIDL